MPYERRQGSWIKHVCYVIWIGFVLIVSGFVVFGIWIVPMGLTPDLFNQNPRLLNVAGETYFLLDIFAPAVVLLATGIGVLFWAQRRRLLGVLIPLLGMPVAWGALELWGLIFLK